MHHISEIKNNPIGHMCFPKLWQCIQSLHHAWNSSRKFNFFGVILHQMSEVGKSISKKMQSGLWKIFNNDSMHDIEGLMQERRNSIAIALELRISYTNPSICSTSHEWCWQFTLCWVLLWFVPGWLHSYNVSIYTCHLTVAGISCYKKCWFTKVLPL